MSMRRFKAAANLIQPQKRKPRPEIKAAQTEVVENVPPALHEIAVESNVTPVSDDAQNLLTTAPVDAFPESPTILVPPKPENKADNSSFKYPLTVDYSHLAQSNVVDDVFHSDIEEQAMQKSVNGYPMSPSKTQSRQRIRPTPIFGQRRNSFVGTLHSLQSNNDDMSSVDFAVPTNHRRERHYSASHSQTSSSAASPYYHHPSPHKYMPSMGMGRIRTESGCSGFSDSYAASTKSRKTDENTNRLISRRDYEARFTNGVPDKSTLKMFDLIYYNPATNPMEQKASISKVKKEEEDSKECLKEIKPKAETIEPVVQPVPQLKLNSKGELILDDKSLEIETTAEQEARKVLANSSLIFLDENTGMNGFYKRQKRTKEWQPDETVKFYRCLQTIGTDFSLMVQLFPKRTRRDLKLKFKKEERCNGALINKALLRPKIFNVQELKDQLDAEENQRAEDERQWKELQIKEGKKSKNTKCKGSTGARPLKTGDDIYNYEKAIKQKSGKKAFKKIANAISTTSPSKRKRENKVKIDNVCILQPNLNIKMEVINSAGVKTLNNDDREEAYQLENELTELLHVESIDNVTHSSEIVTANANENMDITNKKTLVDLDGGSITFVDAVSTEDAMQISSGHELNESDIQKILQELAEGSLVLVSTLDPDDADKVLNEIYIMDKGTGELCDKPLEIPNEIVQGILSVMS